MYYTTSLSTTTCKMNTAHCLATVEQTNPIGMPYADESSQFHYRCKSQPLSLTRPVSWTHTIPSYMPWQSVNRAAPPGVMWFTGSPTYVNVRHPVPGNGMPVIPVTHYPYSPQCIMSTHLQGNQMHQLPLMKRKGSPVCDDIDLPNKIYLTEEKMAARFENLSISNQPCGSIAPGGQILLSPEFLAHVQATKEEEPVETMKDLDSRLQDMEINEKASTSASHAVIVMAPELQNLARHEPILPKSILDKLQQPSMELVLWKPPGGIVESLIKSITSKSDDMDPISACQSDCLNNNLGSYKRERNSGFSRSHSVPPTKSPWKSKSNSDAPSTSFTVSASPTTALPSIMQPLTIEELDDDMEL